MRFIYLQTEWLRYLLKITSTRITYTAEDGIGNTSWKKIILRKMAKQTFFKRYYYTVRAEQQPFSYVLFIE